MVTRRTLIRGMRLRNVAGKLALQRMLELGEVPNETYGLLGGLVTFTLFLTHGAVFLSLKTHGDIVVKPLHGFAGGSVFRIGPDGRNLASLIELFNQAYREPHVVQAFLPEVAQGDKRIILIDGEVAGAINRVPGEGEFRSNLHRGGLGVGVGGELVAADEVDGEDQLHALGLRRDRLHRAGVLARWTLLLLQLPARPRQWQLGRYRGHHVRDRRPLVPQLVDTGSRSGGTSVGSA